jgi:NADPH:quinone reductase
LRTWAYVCRKNPASACPILSLTTLGLRPAFSAQVVDAALYNDAIVLAIRDGGTVTSGRQHVGFSERSIVWHKVFVNEHTTRTDVLNTLRDLVEAGTLTQRVAGTLPAERAADAHRRLEAGGLRGRLILTR